MLEPTVSSSTNSIEWFKRGKELCHDNFLALLILTLSYFILSVSAKFALWPLANSFVAVFLYFSAITISVVLLSDERDLQIKWGLMISILLILTLGLGTLATVIYLALDSVESMYPQAIIAGLMFLIQIPAEFSPYLVIKKKISLSSLPKVTFSMIRSHWKSILGYYFIAIPLFLISSMLAAIPFLYVGPLLLASWYIACSKMSENLDLVPFVGTVQNP